MASSMPARPLQHRCHDYKLLVQQWRSLTKRAGLRMKEFAKAGPWPIFYLETRLKKSAQEPAWHYISAGVHGDEPAPPWALLEWAEENVSLLKSHPFLIFPVLNPVGLMLNTRTDQRGVDLNRAFNSTDDPLIVAWNQVVAQRRFAIGMCLHEDYDGQGCYVYELTHRKESIGKKILKDTSRIVATDGRKRIDGRGARDGLIIRRIPPQMPGLPEAIVLHNLGSPVTLTFESPSEFCLTDRTAVQKRFIESSLKHGAGLA